MRPSHSPAPTFRTSFHIFHVLEGRLGMPTVLRALFSSGSPSLVHSVLCSSRLQRRRQRLQSYLYAVEAAVRVRSALVHGCLGGTQNVHSRCCSGCLQSAVARGLCLFRSMLRYRCVGGVLGALLSVTLRPNKFLCLLGAFAGSPRAMQECAWAAGPRAFSLCLGITFVLQTRARAAFWMLCLAFLHAPNDVSVD